jgi:hypothetical protein
MARHPRVRDNLAEARAFRLGDWEITRADGVLRKGKTSRRLPPLRMRLLVFLVSHAGEVVSKRDMLPRVWDNEAVSADSQTGIPADRSPELGSAVPHAGASAAASVRVLSLTSVLGMQARPSGPTSVLSREPRGNTQHLHATYHTAAPTCGTAQLLRAIDEAFAKDGAAGLYRAVAKHAETCNPERAFPLPEVIIAYTAAGNRERV